MINQIQEDTGADISIEDDGTVYIGATDGPSAEAARAAVNAIANPQMPEIGERFLGTVVKTTTFGAFISLLPGKDGLLHISEIRKLVGGKRIDAVEDVLAVGQKVQVELKEIDPRGKLSLGAVVDAAAAQSGADAPVAEAPVADAAVAEAPVVEAPAAEVPEAAAAAEAPQLPGVDAAAPVAEHGAAEEADAGSGEAGEGGDRPRRQRRRRGGRGRGGSADHAAEGAAGAEADVEG